MGLMPSYLMFFGAATSNDINDSSLLIIKRNLLRWISLVKFINIIVGPDKSPLSLPDAYANSLSYVKAFGGTHQGNIPNTYTQVNYVTNTAQTAVDTGIMIDFAKNYEFEVECRATTGSWYILQSRASSSGNITGINGATSGSTITLVVGNVTVCTSAITRTVGNKLYVKATLNNGTATLYVKDETANTEDTQTGSYGTSQPNPTASVYLLGNAGGQYVGINSDIYMARIKENDTVVMDYVPARQGATAGFYDTVSGTFKTAETPANLSADGNTIPTPDAPMNIVCNNGALKYGKPITLDDTRYYAYLAVAENWSYSVDSYSIIVPVEVGKQYRITADTTTPIDGVTNTILRWAFADTLPPDSWKVESSTAPTPKDIAVYDKVRTTPQETPSAIVTATHPYMIVQMGSGIFASNIANGRISVAEQSIYTDGTVETIKVCGKNLFDSSSDDNEWVKINGEIEHPVTTKSNRISAHSGSVFTVSTSNAASSSNIILVTFWSEGGEMLLRQAYTSGTTHTVTAPAGTAQLLVSCRTWENAGNVQVENGSTATDYEAYHNGGTATAEMLLKVGDYQDEQEILSGAVTRKVGVKVFDGTETTTWIIQAARAYVSKANIGLSDAKNETNCISTHFGSSIGVNIVSINTYGNVLFYYDLGNLGITSVAQWNQFLADQYAAGTPVIVVYPLATPTTESVAGQTLQVTDGDNTLEITQASLTGLELEAKYKKKP